ncbi:MAG: DUF4157 domain-containing protein [Roseobacter sp.]
MSQIFASDRSTPATPVSRKPQFGRTTTPERTLAGLQRRADQSNATARLTQLQAKGHNAVQRMDAPEEEMLQGKFVQRMEEEDALQGKAIGPAIQRQENNGLSKGGLPLNLQSGIEQLSGTNLDNVNVHYNSPKPAAVQAHAYAQGSDIHLASGQEKHLPHEAWHVVQQKQGRVKPTVDVAGMPVNDDAGLEKEADVMGAKASQMMSRKATS